MIRKTSPPQETQRQRARTPSSLRTRWLARRTSTSSAHVPSVRKHRQTGQTTGGQTHRPSQHQMTRRALLHTRDIRTCCTTQEGRRCTSIIVIVRCHVPLIRKPRQLRHTRLGGIQRWHLGIICHMARFYEPGTSASAALLWRDDGSSIVSANFNHCQKYAFAGRSGRHGIVVGQETHLRASVYLTLWSLAKGFAY